MAKIYKDKESIAYSKLQNEEKMDEGEEIEIASYETTEQVKIPALPDYDSMLQGATDEKKNNAKRKAPKKSGVTKNKRDTDNDNQIALTVQGGLVVNGLDVIKYIRGLEGRISELERKLEESSNKNPDMV